MDSHQLHPGQRVVVEVFSIARELNYPASPKMYSTATVLERNGESWDSWWLDVDLVGGESIPQLYAPEEILGLYMPDVHT